MQEIKSIYNHSLCAGFCDTPPSLLQQLQGQLFCLLALHLYKFILKFVAKMPKIRGGKTFYSGQEASQLIFMNSDSEGEDVYLGEDLVEHSEKGSDWEADEEDLDYQTAEEDEDLSLQSQPKK